MPLLLADRRDAEELANVEHAEPADLDVMAQELRRPAEDEPRRPPVAPDDVVGDEPVSAHDELERALALADAALSEQQNADAEHVDQHAVQLRLRRESVVENGVQGVDRPARSRVGHEERRARRLGRRDEGARRLLSAGDDDARETEREETRGRRRCARPA